MQGKCCTDTEMVTSNFDRKSSLNPSELLILVIDNNADNLELTSKLISYYGFQVMTAANSQIGLEIFYKYKPSMVLVELMLPDVDGIDFVRSIRARANWVPMVALTSLPSCLFYEKALRAGFNAYIEKPFQFETLEYVLTRCLNVQPSPF
jgi:two-component system, cell cycle response regulator DivK